MAFLGEFMKKVKKQEAQIYGSIDMQVPSETTDIFWVYARNGNAKSAETLGKWCIYLQDFTQLDELWFTIRDSISEGRLDCPSAKCSTNHPERIHNFTIAVYTNDDNVDAIGSQLCNIVKQPWFYKLDNAHGDVFWKTIEWSNDESQIVTNPENAPVQKKESNTSTAKEFVAGEVNFLIDFEGNIHEACASNTIVGLGLKSYVISILNGVEGGFGAFTMDLNGNPFPSRIPVGEREDFIDGCTLVFKHRGDGEAKRSGET